MWKKMFRRGMEAIDGDADRETLDITINTIIKP